uniref:C2H2-type domain-containing protein n=1 Tax=viral metagenome TaxID=1070528 RepID=A0A6C0EQ06_9ZZZZ
MSSPQPEETKPSVMEDNVHINVTVVNNGKEDDKHQCPACSESFDNGTGLKYHIRRGSCAGIEHDEEKLKFYYDTALKDLEKVVGSTEVTAYNIFEFTVSLEQAVERYEGLCGKEKKRLVMRTMEEYMKSHECDMAILQFLSGFIDISIVLDKGQEIIKTVAESTVLCCSGFSALCSRGNKKGKKKCGTKN